MKRTIRVAGLFALGFVAVNWLGAEPPKKEDDKPAVVRSQSRDASHICAALRMPIGIDKPIEDLPLREALDLIGEKFGINFVINEVAFELEGVKGTVLEQPARLQKMPGVNLNTALSYLLERHKGAILVRNDHVEVTTVERAAREAANGTSVGCVPPIIHAAFKQTPLDVALANLADQSGKNVVLDRQVVEKEMPAITARLLNVPVDTAVRLAADLTGLRVAVLDNVFMVTTPNRAAALEAEHAKTKQIRTAAAPPGM